MDSFSGKLAVVTGGGSGMGRELVRQLAARGCSVAACDLNADAVAETAAVAREEAPPGVVVTSHACDVAEEAQVLRFRDELLAEHGADHVDLVFSNAGIGGGGSFVNDRREDWERTFAVDWWGVYYCARAFLPLLIASGDGVLVNTSSVNGFWATLGPGMPNTAYCTAKFAVKGFTEALIEDLRARRQELAGEFVQPGGHRLVLCIACVQVSDEGAGVDETGPHRLQFCARIWRRHEPAPGRLTLKRPLRCPALTLTERSASPWRKMSLTSSETVRPVWVARRMSASRSSGAMRMVSVVLM